MSATSEVVRIRASCLWIVRALHQPRIAEAG